MLAIRALFAALVSCLVLVGLNYADDPSRSKPFGIEVVDESTRRGVPLVELRTTHGLRFVTDSAGLAAIDAPELVGQKIYFHVASHGYAFPPDGFQFRGKALDVIPGQIAQLVVRRVNIAERLYRVTGAGIYADSAQLGRPAPIRQPLLNAHVSGSDSVVNAIYRGRLYWFWGDTNRLGYPLGNFHVPGATSKLPRDGGLNPAQGVDLEYFVGPQGFAKETARMDGEGPTWIGGLAALPDSTGAERLLAAYVKVRKGLEVYRQGLATFDDDQQRFVHHVEMPLSATLLPDGHPFRWRDGEREYCYFPNPYPWTRSLATVEAYLDVARYEGFTCLKPGDLAGAGPVERDADGRVVWGWKMGTAPLSEKLQRRLLDEGQLKANEAWLGIVSRDAGKGVTAHRGAVAWNEFRRRWIMIFVQHFGDSSVLGEVWYAEADRPEGPWKTARKIMTHDKYSFYNPKLHPYFDEDGGKRIFFEGTYTHTFSGNSDQTPRYEYNQLLYRLDLEDPRLNSP